MLQLSLARGVATPRAGEQKGNLEKQRSFEKSNKAVLVYLHDQPTNTYTRTSKPRTHSSVRRSHILALPSSLPEMSIARLGIITQKWTFKGEKGQPGLRTLQTSMTLVMLPSHVLGPKYE